MPEEKAMPWDAPVGIFDSGLGGISVLKSAARLLPFEDFLYYGDSRNAPYGTKEKREVVSLTEKSLLLLRERGCKAVVIACNTATCAAAAVLRERYPDFPILGIEPAVKPALSYEKEKGSRILVLATPLTLREEKYHRLVEGCGGGDRIVSLPCPGIPELVEQGELRGEKIDALLEKLLSPYRGEHFSCVVLGCTHYPFIKDAIRRRLGLPPDTPVIDGADGTARELKRRLAAAGLLRENRERSGSVRFENSDRTKLALSQKLFLSEI